MALQDELFKLYDPLKPHANLLIRHRRHPCQLRLVAKARHILLRDLNRINVAAQFNYDMIVYRHYID